MPAQEKKGSPTGAKSKIWVATKDSVAGFGIKPEEAIMAGSEKNFFGASKTGLAIVGSALSFLMRAETIREGGLWAWMPSEMRMIPSSMMTPSPAVTIMTPMPAMLNVVMAELPSFLSLGSVIGG